MGAERLRRGPGARGAAGRLESRPLEARGGQLRRRQDGALSTLADELPVSSLKRLDHPHAHALRRRQVLLRQVRPTAAAHVAAADGAETVHEVVHGAGPEEVLEELGRRLRLLLQGAGPLVDGPVTQPVHADGVGAHVLEEHLQGIHVWSARAGIRAEYNSTCITARRITAC